MIYNFVHIVTSRVIVAMSLLLLVLLLYGFSPSCVEEDVVLVFNLSSPYSYSYSYSSSSSTSYSTSYSCRSRPALLELEQLLGELRDLA